MARRPFGLLLIALFILVGGTAWSASPSVIALLHQAEQEIARGNLSTAENLVNQALEQDPGYIPLWKAKSRIHLLARDYESAIQSILQPLKVAPSDGESLLILFKALMAVPENTAARYDLSLPSFLAGLDDAVAARMALELLETPQDTTLMLRFSTAWKPASEEMAFLTKALSAFARKDLHATETLIMGLEDKMAAGKALAGRLSFLVGKAFSAKAAYEEAERSLQRAGKLGYDKVSVQGELGWVYFNMGKRKLAADTWEAYWRNAPNVGAWSQWIADAALADGDYHRAAEFLEKALQFQPNDAMLQGRYIFALLMTGQKGKLDNFKTRLENKGFTDSVHFGNALYLKENKRFDEAVDELRRIRDRGIFQEEFSAFAQILAADPPPVEESRLYLENIRFLLMNSSDKPSVLRDLAWVYWADGYPDHALALWEEALNGGLANPEPLILQVTLRLLEIGRESEAMGFLKRYAPSVTIPGFVHTLVISQRYDLAARAAKYAPAGEAAPYMDVYAALGNIKSGAVNPGLAALRRAASGPPAKPITTKGFDADSRIADVTMTPKHMGLAYASLALTILDQELVEAFPIFTSGQLRGFSGGTLAGFQAEAGRILIRNNQPVEAVKYLEASLKLDPENAKALIYLSILRDIRPLSEDEADRLEAALAKASPQDREYILGETAYYRGEYSAAADHFIESLAHNQGDHQLRLRLIALLVRERRFTEARLHADWFGRAMARGDTRFSKFAALAKTDVGEAGEAVRIWLRLLSRDPGSLDHLAGLGRALNLDGQFQETVNLLAAKVEKTGDPPLALILCEAETLLGRYADALHHAETGLAASPDNTQLLRIAAESAETLQDYPLAEKYARRYLELDSDTLAVQNLLGRTLLDQGKYVLAEEHFQELLKRNPVHEASLRGMTSRYQAVGLAPEAEEYAGRLHSEMPTDPGVCLKYGIAAGADREFNDAYSVLRPMQALGPDASIMTLYYPQVLDQDEAKGVNRFSQWRDHIRVLHERKALFLSLDEFGREGSYLSRPPEKKPPAGSGVVILVGQTDRSTLEKMDALLKSIEARANLVVGGESLVSDTPYALDRSDLDWLASTGRWSIVLTDTRPPDILRNNGKKGIFWGQAKGFEGRSETGESMQARLQSRIRLFKKDAEGLPISAWYCPGGLAPRMMLDVSVTERNAYAHAVEFEFDVVLVSSPEGFQGPLGDRHNWPARNVPATWTSEDLLLHMDQVDPQHQVTLQLAKVHTWHNQLERANDLYLQAGEQGVNPAELSYNHGANALQQGDIPTAMELLRKAAELDPESVRVRNLLTRAYMETRPLAGFTGNYWWDNEDRSFTRLGVFGEYHPKENLMLFARADYLNWSREALGSDFSLNGWETTVGARSYFHPQYWAEARLSVLGVESGEAFIGYGATLHGPISTDFLRINGAFDLDYSLERIDTQEAIEAEIFNNHLMVRSHVRILDDWELWANGHAMMRTDDNATYMLDGRFTYRLFEYPLIHVGYAFQFGDSDRDPIEYWAPVNLQSHLAYLSVSAPVADWLRINANAAYGPSKSEGNSWRDIWRTGVAAEWIVSDSVRANLQYSYYTTPTYNLNQIWFGITVRF